MKRHLYIIFLILIVLAGNSPAQDAHAHAVPTPPVSDVQKVQPEDLKGVPDVAPGYRSDDRELPDLGRVGVDMTEQKPLTLNEAIGMALENNKDIEVTRKNVKIAEFDLQAARGVYEPRFSGQTYYERVDCSEHKHFQHEPDHYDKFARHECGHGRLYSEIRHGAQRQFYQPGRNERQSDLALEPAG